jgi:hypothetical protein
MTAAVVIAVWAAAVGTVDTIAAVDTIATRAAAVEAITQVPRDVRVAAAMTEEPAVVVAAVAITEALQDAAAAAVVETAAAVVETMAAVEEIMVAAEATTEAVKEALPAIGDSAVSEVADSECRPQSEQGRWKISSPSFSLCGFSARMGGYAWRSEADNEWIFRNEVRER